MSLDAGCEVRVDNNQLQDQVFLTCDNWVGFQKSAKKQDMAKQILI